MADNNNDEKLKITAELDTSKLKQQAKSGLNEVANETKKVENQAKQASKAIDDIGTSTSKAAQKGTQALKQMGKEADETAKKVNRLAKLDTSVGNIKLGQAIGLANQFTNSDTGKAIGGYLANQVGMSGDMQGLASGALSGGLAGASMGAMLGGGLGAAVGGLVGAGAGLLSAAKEQEKAAAALIESADKRQALNKDRTKELDRQEAEAKKNKEFDTKFNELIANGDFAGANKLVEEARKEYQSQFELGDKGIHNSKIQMDATPLENRGANYKSYDDYLTMRTSGQAGLTRMDNYEARIKAAQGVQGNDDASVARRNQIIANMQHEDKLKTEIKGLEGQVRNGSEEEFNNIRNGLVEAIKKNKEQMEKSAKDGPAFNKAQQELADNERKLNAVLKARQDVVKEENEQEKTKYKNQIDGLQTELKDQESFMGKVSNVKLTDSLTKMGGGSGYGVQMQGINSYVSKMSGNVANIKTTIEKCLTSIQEIQNKVSPYGGQFVGENE